VTEIFTAETLSRVVFPCLALAPGVSNCVALPHNAGIVAIHYLPGCSSRYTYTTEPRKIIRQIKILDVLS
jgi:hypothetical protein